MVAAISVFFQLNHRWVSHIHASQLGKEELVFGLAASLFYVFRIQI